MADQCMLGDDYPIYFPAARDARGAIVDLSGATLYCTAKTDGATGVDAALTFIDDASGGLARARFTSAQTAQFTSGATYVFDGRVKLQSGLIYTIGRGTFVAKTAKTPTPTT